MVDPYEWLGLPKGCQATPYQLLGINSSIVDPAALRFAADRQLRRVLPHLTGDDALEAERLYAEIEDARDLLLNPEARAQYDAQYPPSDIAPGESAQPDSSPAPLDLATVTDEAPTAAPMAANSPWWRSAAEAPASTDPWWKQAASDLGAESGPRTVAPLATAAEPVKPHVWKIPTSTPPAPRPAVRAESRFPLTPVLAGVVLILGAVAIAVYYFEFTQSSQPTTPKSDTLVTSSTIEPKNRPELPSHQETIDSSTAPTLSKDFVEQLRPRTFIDQSGAVNSIAISSSGGRFASGGADRTLRVTSIRDDDVQNRLNFDSPIVTVAWCDSDRRVVAADGLSVALADSSKSNAPRLLESPRGGVTTLAASADGTRAVTGLSDGFIRVWDSSTGRFDEWAVAARGPVTSVDVNADGTQALSAVNEGSVVLWNLSKRNRLHEWNPHAGGAIVVRLSPDGTKAATGAADGQASVHDLSARREVCRLEGHMGPVTGIVWLPDNRHLVTASVDGTARMWSAETGQQLRWTQMLQGKGTCVAVDRAGRFVLVGTSTGVIHLFPLPRVQPDLTTGTPVKPPALPLPVPEAAAVTAALADVRHELAKDFQYTRPDDMALLADKLRRRAWAERLASPLRYGLLQESRALATQAGDTLTALRASDDLAQWFDVDELAEKAATIGLLSAEVDKPTLIALGLETAEHAETDARLEVLQRLLDRLPTGMVAGVSADRAARLASIRRRARAAADELKLVRRALDTLKNAPGDQAANQTVGVYLCLSRQDWANGLPFLSKGTDRRLSDAARADLTPTADPKVQHRLGEQWYALAIDTGDQRAKRALLGRARIWFERELKLNLKVDEEIKARNRLSDLAKLDVPARDTAVLPLYSPVLIRRAYNTIAADVLRNEWQLDSGAVPRPDGVLLPGGSPLMQSRFGLAPGGRLTLTFAPDGREIRIACAGQEFAFATSNKTIHIAIARDDSTVTLAARVDGLDPVSRSADLPPAARTNLPIVLRLTGQPERTGGATVTSAVVRGAMALSLPIAE